MGTTITRTSENTVSIALTETPVMTPRDLRRALRALNRERRQVMRAVRRGQARQPIASRATRAGRQTTARRVAGFVVASRTAAARGPDADQPGEEPGDIGSAATSRGARSIHLVPAFVAGTSSCPGGNSGDR